MRDAKRDAVRLDRRHHTNPSAMTPPEAWYEQIVGYIVASRTASWTVAPGTTASSPFPTSFVAQNVYDRPAFHGWTTGGTKTHRPAVWGKGCLIVVGDCGDLVEPNRRRSHQPDRLAAAGGTVNRLQMAANTGVLNSH
jgi:hypothetical protein